MIQIAAILILLVADLLFSPPATARTPGFLGRNGQHIFNDSGVVHLRGINLGNWLYLEPQLLGAPKWFRNHAEWNKGLKDVLGTDENMAEFYKTWRSSYITEADVLYLKNLGFNSVRVPLDYHLFIDYSTREPKSEGYVYLDALVKWCANAGLYVILDMHETPGGQRDSEPEPGKLYYDWYPQDVLIKAWKNIATRYASHPWIGGYDLVNEPVVKNQVEKWRVRDLYLRMTSAIREVDTNHLIFAEGNYHASDLWDLDPIWDENLALSIHNYWTAVPNPQLADQVHLAKKSNVPLWLGEFGENSNPWIHAQKRSVEDYGIGWSFWNYKSLTYEAHIVSAPLTEGYRKLLDYWHGVGPKPSQDDALKWLKEMAQRTAFPNCQENRDVVDALVRADFKERNVPYAHHAIPGRIYAADYDMGDQDRAYWDKVHEQTAQDADHWNTGKAYRNDGVDIGWSLDDSWEPHVGWVDTGEWQSFTLDSTAGRPTISIRYAAVSDSRMRIEMDRLNITGSVWLPSTGGWLNWSTITVTANASLSAGTHTMRIVPESGGFNLRYFDFTGM